MNVANLLLRAGRAFTDRPALAVGDEVHATYGTLARRVASLTRSLRVRFGLRADDRVALVMKNCRQYIEVLFACWYGGMTVVPINAKLHGREFAYILQHSGARVCFVTADLEPVVAGLASDLPALGAVVSVDDEAYELLMACDPVTMEFRTPDDLAWLFYTSGTTGRPKGAMLSHRNLLAMTLCYFADVDSISPGDCILHAAPLSHGSGMYVLPHVAAAALQVIPASGGFDPAEIYALIAAHPGASFFAAPTMVHRLVEYPLAASRDTRNLKTIVYGGGPMYVADCKRTLDLFGHRLVQIYGQGESPMTITALSKARHAETDHPRYEARLASVGIADAVVQVAVVGPDDEMLPPAEEGEVVVRGDSVMHGYWRDPQATAESLRGGWLHTGDIGVLDEDGFLTLKDRSKDLIISGGSNIYPREIEEVLLRDPNVAEVSCVGCRDADWGEVVVAFVVPAAHRTVDEAALDTLCLENLARFKRPKRYHLVESLPKNNYGKVLKTELRERLKASAGEGS